MDLQIKTGKKVYTLKDEYGNEIGKIAFNPGDQNFVARVKGFKDYLESEDGTVAEIDRLSNEGKVEEAIELMTKLDKNIKAKIDEIFDAKTPFYCTTEKDRCTYCDYKNLCGER